MRRFPTGRGCPSSCCPKLFSKFRARSPELSPAFRSDSQLAIGTTSFANFARTQWCAQPIQRAKREKPRTAEHGQWTISNQLTPLKLTCAAPKFTSGSPSFPLRSNDLSPFAALKPGAKKMKKVNFHTDGHHGSLRPNVHSLPPLPRFPRGKRQPRHANTSLPTTCTKQPADTSRKKSKKGSASQSCSPRSIPPSLDVDFGTVTLELATRNRCHARLCL